MNDVTRVSRQNTTKQLEPFCGKMSFLTIETEPVIFCVTINYFIIHMNQPT